MIAPKGARVVVLGLAVTGRAVARILAEAGADVLASDAGDGVPADVVSELTATGVDVETGSHDRAHKALRDADFVVPSPGISPRGGVLAEAIALGVPIVSEFDLAQRVTNAPVVAVTGTKGKTTVCRLAERILRASGRDAFACGNNEVPFVAAAVDHPSADAFVVEASSFRLYFARSFHPRVAVLTNLAPDHLDWHESMDDYVAAKARVAANQTGEDLYLYPSDQPELAELASGARGLSFGGPGSAAWVEGDDVVVALDGVLRAPGVAALAARGPHFAADAAAAAAASVFLGAGAADISAGLDGFVLDPHRLELVGRRNGVTFYDDSTATNPLAAVAAIRAVGREGPVVLIAGGRKKVPDLSPVAGEWPRLRAVVATGEAAPDVVAVFRGTGVPVEQAAGMADAVERAAAIARPGDAVLLAPACASQDAYTDYAERGREFARACRLLGVGM